MLFCRLNHGYICSQKVQVTCKTFDFFRNYIRKLIVLALRVLEAYVGIAKKSVQEVTSTEDSTSNPLVPV